MAVKMAGSNECNTIDRHAETAAEKHISPARCFSSHIAASMPNRTQAKTKAIRVKDTRNKSKLTDGKKPSNQREIGPAIRYPKGTSANGRMAIPCLGVLRRMIITAIARIKTIMTQHSADIKIPFLFLISAAHSPGRKRQQCHQPKQEPP